MIAHDPPLRFVRCRHHDQVCWAVADADDRFVLSDRPPWVGEAVRGEPFGSLAELSLLAPVTPSKIVCVGRNYQAHAAEHGVAVPAEPLLFLKPPSALIAHRAAIILPPQSAQVEHEGELGVVIGRRARKVREEEAWQYVCGVVVANDVTARDLQRQDSQWTRGKGFDTFCPVGPCLVAGLSEAAVGELELSCRVNGVLRQQGNTRQMAFTPAFLVAYISAVMTLEPGDLILTGTPSGVGPLHPGDVVEVEVAGVGILSNPVLR